MTPEHDKFVELAEKHGIQVAKGEHDFGVFPQSLVAMFAEYREELAQRSADVVELLDKYGVACWADDKADMDHPGTEKKYQEVREAIASLEARLEQAQKENEAGLEIANDYCTKWKQSEARVRELEQGIEKIMAVIRANLTVNKESGK